MTLPDRRPPRARFEHGTETHYRLSPGARRTRCGLTEEALLGLLLDTEDSATCPSCILEVHGRPAA